MPDNQTIIEDWDLLGQVSQAYRNLMDAFMDQIALHRAQGMLLCRLFVQDGVTQSEIAAILNVQGATVTNMLQRMEEAEYITRQRDAEDNRLVRVYLTDKGREKERLIADQLEKLDSTIFEGLDATDRETLRQLLKVVLKNMTPK